MIKNIKPMTTENFKDFGWLLKYPADVEPDISIPDLDYWKNPMDLSNFKGDGELSFMRVKQRSVELKNLNYLPETIEIYLSLDGQRSVFFAAPGENGNSLKPDIDRLEAFLFSGPGGFAVKAGIWHWTPFPLTHDADYALGLRNNVILVQDGTISIGEGQMSSVELEESIKINL